MNVTWNVLSLMVEFWTSKMDSQPSLPFHLHHLVTAAVHGLEAVIPSC